MNSAAPNPRATRIPRRALLAVVVLGLGAWIVWAAAIRNNVTPRNFGVVEEGRIYRSAALTPAAIARVQSQYGIKTIVDLGGFDKDPEGGRVAARTASALGIQRFVFELEGDGTGNPNAYVQALRVLADPSKQPVLVHCSAGAQRTSGCVLLYEDIVRGHPINELYPSMQAFGHDPRRNPKLKPFLDEWSGRIREAFRSGSPITGFPSLAPEPTDQPVFPARAVLRAPMAPPAAPNAPSPTGG